MQKLFTIGYGGRKPSEFADELVKHQIKTIVDVRLRPDKASMGSYVKARSPEKGIEALLNNYSIKYISLIELGNVFLGFEDWKNRYSQLMDIAGHLLTERIRDVPKPFCLLCAEKSVENCHRKQIAEYLEKEGWQVQHLE